MNNSQEEMRKQIDVITDNIIERAQEMISQDVPVILAFRLCIAWEIEVTMLRNQVAVITWLTKAGFQPTDFTPHIKAKTG